MLGICTNNVCQAIYNLLFMLGICTRGALDDCFALFSNVVCIALFAGRHTHTHTHTHTQDAHPRTHVHTTHTCTLTFLLLACFQNYVDGAQVRNAPFNACYQRGGDTR
jgi:hypothetical protein